MNSNKFTIDQKFCHTLVKAVVSKKLDNGISLFYSPAMPSSDQERQILALDASEMTGLASDCVLLAADIKGQKLGLQSNFSGYNCSMGNAGLNIKPLGQPKWGYVEGLPLLYDVIEHDLYQCENIMEFYQKTIQQIDPNFQISYTNDQEVYLDINTEFSM